ncbi:MAG: deoxyhypusine synthase [Nanoarchaeota archaeon]
MEFKGKRGKGPKNHHTYAAAKTNTLEGFPTISGLDFEKKVDIDALIKSLGATGFQATQLAQAIDIVNQMRKDKATIFLSCTSNIITSGLRDTIRYLVKHKMIDVLVTSAGGIEEDLIKCLKPFVIGTFEAPGAVLHKEGINRTGNVFVPNDRFVRFEDFIDPILDELYARQKKEGVIDSATLIHELGRRIDNEESILYWAQKNKIPVFCPAITDGSLGDLIFFQKQKHKDFQIDITGDMYKIVRLTQDADKTGCILLGGGSPKHYVLNAQLFRDGTEYAVYINTAQEYDGSDSGARPDEAVSWGKIKINGKAVKVHAEATLVFPLLVAATFAKKI